MPVGDDAVITHISTPGKPATQNAWLHPSWKVWDGPLAQSSYYADEELFFNCSLCKNVSPNIANCMDKNKGPIWLMASLGTEAFCKIPVWRVQILLPFLCFQGRFFFCLSIGRFFFFCPSLPPVLFLPCEILLHITHTNRTLQHSKQKIVS